MAYQPIPAQPDGTVNTSVEGIVIQGDDGTNVQNVHVDSSGDLQVDILTMPAVVVSGTADTELPPAALLTDNMANPTAPAVAAHGMLWNGATWDRAPGNSVAGATVSDAAAEASLSVIDDWDESDRAKVNLIAGQVGVAGGAGTVDALTQRVTHASDDPVTTSVQLIDDVVFIDDTATHSTGSTKGIGIMAAATPTDTAVNANDIGMLAMSLDRRLNADVNVQQGDADVGAANPLQVSLANTDANATAVKVNVASGGIASGAVASGAVASGAVASGALAAGSIAVGAIAAGATSIADNEDVGSADGDRGVKVLAVRKATPANTSGSDGDYEFLQLSAGRLWTSTTITANDGVDIGNVDVASVVPGTAATNLGKAEDAAHSSGDTGVMALGVAQNVASPAAFAAAGDYTPLGVDTEGSTIAIGNRAHDAVDSGAPLKVGGRATNAEITAIANNDRADFLTDLVGKLITLPYSVPESSLKGTANATGTSNTEIIAAQGSGVRIYVTTLVIANSSSTNTTVLIKSATTEIMRIPAPANSGAIVTLPKPLQLTANEALNFASGTSVTTMYVSAVGYKGA